MKLELRFILMWGIRLTHKKTKETESSHNTHLLDSLRFIKKPNVMPSNSQKNIKTVGRVHKCPLPTALLFF